MSPAKSKTSARGAKSEKTDAPATFLVGIDLGTTNSALAYVDTRVEKPAVQVLQVPQLVRPGAVEARDHLPSALYVPGGEVAPAARELPFAGPDPDTIVGRLALEQGAKVPHRLVTSAKSWLCHPGVDRREPILPWGQPAEEGAPHLSPLEAARRVLLHLKGAWDHTIAKDDDALALANQELLLCVPASFDPQARDLTLEAARAAGLERITLVEEPLAAFYAWLDRTGNEWRKRLKVGDLVLVVDVGGGTTDLTLIAAKEEGGNLTLERVAVGEHLLLGGDNMDLALAHVAATRLKAASPGAKDLDPWQSRALWLQCRTAKEALLADPTRKTAEVVVLGRGTKLIGNTMKTELTQEDVQAICVNGFFPACAASTKPQRRRGAGLAELGLPYEPDAAITKHLAAFLTKQDTADGVKDGFARPTAVLFNGGVFKGGVLRTATVDALKSWLGGAPLEVLEGEDLDLAVARGAAYYGLVRRGKGVRVRGGTARTFYLGIESTLPAVPGLPPPLKALCVAPFGLEEGSSVDLPGKEFALLTGEPAEFRFLSSTTRKEDKPGALLDQWEEGELVELTPLQVSLPADKADKATGHRGTPVTLRSTVTEVGTLEVHCVAKDGRRFKLEWNVRGQEG